MDGKKFKCCICGKTCTGYGNNPYPVIKKKGARCCDMCNIAVCMTRFNGMLHTNTLQEPYNNEESIYF